MVGVDRATTTEPGRTPPGPRPPDPPSRVSGVVALLVLVTVATSLSGPWDAPMRDPGLPPPEDLAPEDLPTFPPLEPPAVENLEEFASEPWNLTWLGILLLTVLAFWLIYLALSWLRRHQFELTPGSPDDAGILPGQTVGGLGNDPDLPSLRRGVSDAGEELRTNRSPADAVIAAWVALEAAAARSGVKRDPASTPTEFTVAVLDRTPADPAATRALLDLYLRARFGGEYMTERDVALAKDALAALARGLGTAGEP